MKKEKKIKELIIFGIVAVALSTAMIFSNIQSVTAGFVCGWFCSNPSTSTCIKQTLASSVECADSGETYYGDSASCISNCHY